MKSDEIAGTILGLFFGFIIIGVLYYIYNKYIVEQGYRSLFDEPHERAQYAKKKPTEILFAKKGTRLNVNVREVSNPMIVIEVDKNKSENGYSNERNRQNSLENSIVNKENEEKEEVEKIILGKSLIIVKSGYLYKKSSSMRRDWLKRWFFIINGKLFYCYNSFTIPKSDKPIEIQAIQVANLLISTVKQISSKEFQIISPGQRGTGLGGGIYELLGDNESDVEDWIRTIKLQIEDSLVDSNTNNSSKFLNITINQDILNNLYAINPTCADCGMESPTWASLNLCIMICIECSGIHRSLGSHISKVRSLTLDKWSNNYIQLLQTIGNSNSNSIWENDSDSGNKIPKDAPREIREIYIINKYVNKIFVNKNSLSIDSNHLLLQAASSGEPLDIIRAISFDADINTTLVINEINTGKTALHLAVENDNILCVELLCLHNINLSLIDMDNLSPYDLAVKLQKLNIVEILSNYIKQ